MTRITIDPITRIEGHLRIDCEVDGGKVTRAWSSGQMWRGIEIILKDRDPRDAWIFTQRICGVCTTVHAIASVRAVENALNLEVPLNAQYIRNMIVAAHGVHDHIVHFYHLARNPALSHLHQALSRVGRHQPFRYGVRLRGGASDPHHHRSYHPH